MKEENKVKRAIEKFEIIAERCRRFGNFSELEDSTVIVGTNWYTTHVNMFDMVCQVFEYFDRYNATLVGQFDI